MELGLLQCDDVAPELRGTHGNYPEMFTRLFQAVDPDVTLRVWRCLDGEIPDDIDAVEAWVTTGSKFGVNDGLAWVDALCGFVRKLWDAGKPLVGVCFGHQLIAKALGGEVVKSERGWGVGMSFNRIDTPAAWMEPQQPGVDLLVSHQDQIGKLPPRAKVLASSDFCPIYLMQVGEHFLGVQGHPEFTKPYSRDLMQLRSGLVGEQRVREGVASLNAPVDDELMARWILNFLHAQLHASRKARSGGEQPSP